MSRHPSLPWISLLLWILFLFWAALAPAEAQAAAQELTIRAVPTLRFDTDTLAVTGIDSVTVHFANDDTGVLHNFAAYTDSSAAEPLASGSIGPVCTAPCSSDVQFALPAPGDYFFRCDVHPTIMTGTFWVLAPPPTTTPPSGGQTPVGSTPTDTGIVAGPATPTGAALPITGQGPVDHSSQTWLVAAALAAAGALLCGLGLRRLALSRRGRDRSAETPSPGS
jgi:plastocyanin